MYGKEIRMKRLFDAVSGKSILIPLDHGATMGPVKGIENIGSFLYKLNESYVNGIVLCKGHFKNRSIMEKCNIPKIMHLSNSNELSSNPDFKVLVGSVEKAIILGADAVSVHVNIGAVNEHVMLKDFAKVSEECIRWGMPLLAMMYYRPVQTKGRNNKEATKIIARLAQEMGADIVKVNYTGDMESFSEVVQGCSIPILIAGGERSTLRQVLQNVSEAMKCGASGVAFGRNIFQMNDPNILTQALSLIVHKGMEVDEVLENVIEIKTIR